MPTCTQASEKISTSVRNNEITARALQRFGWRSDWGERGYFLQNRQWRGRRDVLRGQSVPQPLPLPELSGGDRKSSVADGWKVGAAKRWRWRGRASYGDRPVSTSGTTVRLFAVETAQTCRPRRASAPKTLSGSREPRHFRSPETRPAYEVYAPFTPTWKWFDPMMWPHSSSSPLRVFLHHFDINRLGLSVHCV